MQNFIKIDRQDPAKENVLERLKNFNEIYQKFDTKKAGQQAERCVQCGDPYCSSVGCPLSNYIPHWLKTMAENNLEMAFKISNETSPFPEILGRICPHDRLCEGACTLGQDGYESVTIGSIEASISERAFEAGLNLRFPGITTDKKVAIVGAGPASLSAANFLLRAGIAVEMYERADRAGGLLTYGIPGFKLEKEVVARRVAMLEKGGMKLHLNKEVGKDVSFAQLLERFDAVFIGAGATDPRKAKVTGEENAGVLPAMEFLTAVQKKQFGAELDDRFNVQGKKVVVIGGGDTAMDCVRSSLREGAELVTCAYRRDADNMPGSKKEYVNAKEEGVEFAFHRSPKEILVENGKVTGVVFAETRLGEPDDSGRQRLEVVEGSDETLPADVVIMSLGFNNQPYPFAAEAGIELDKWGAIRTDDTCRTTNEKVFAGGDCIRGADLAVTAARDGRTAAMQMIRMLLA